MHECMYVTHIGVVWDGQQGVEELSLWVEVAVGAQVPVLAASDQARHQQARSVGIGIGVGVAVEDGPRKG